MNQEALRIGFMDTFSTPRLDAVRLQESHLETLCRMHRDPCVMATLGGLRSAEVTRDFLNVNLDHWHRHGFGLWIFTDKEGGQFVGRGGLRHVSVGGNHEAELAYALQSEFWGRGLATEIAEALLQIGTQTLGLTDVVCFTLTTNLASQRVMQKVGFRYERDIIHADRPHVLYRFRVNNAAA